MGQSPIGACLNYVMANIPREVLNIAFDPETFHTTLDKQIASLVINNIVLPDVNLLGGKRRLVTMNDDWKMNIPDPDAYSVFGTGLGSSFYKVPPEAREHRDITQVIGIDDSMTNVYAGDIMPLNGVGTAGNNVPAMMSNMMNSYTHAQDSIMPTVVPAGTNIIKFTPQILVSGVTVAVLIAYDRDFGNMQISAIYALRNLVLAAVKRYIANTLCVKVDEFFASSGMEIGIVKTLIDRYQDEGQQYDELLITAKGAMKYDPSRLDQEIYYRL